MHTPDHLPPHSPPPIQPPMAAQPLPSSTPTTVLVLGILSIVLAGFAILGLILGIIGWKKSLWAEGELAAGRIPQQQLGFVTAGKICSIIGACLSAVVTLFWCLYAGCIGSVIMGGIAADAKNRQQNGIPPVPYTSPR